MTLSPMVYDTSEAHVTAAARHYGHCKPERDAEGVLTFTLDLGNGDQLIYRGTE
jgi:hypothetical protein